MGNIIENFFNRPEAYYPGQIWHCNEISEDIVITDVNDFYLKMGIVRGMIISRATHLDDGKDIKFRPKGELRLLYGLERILLRITDGPLLADDLSFYKADLPRNITSKFNKTLKHRPEMNPFQEELCSKYLEKLQPLREKAFARSEEFEIAMNKLRVFTVLKFLEKRAERIKYKVASADKSESERFDKFWDKERKNRNKSLLLFEDESNVLRLINIEGRIYFTVKSKSFKKISDIRLVQKKILIKAVDEEIVFGQEKRVFTSFEDVPKLKTGKWEIIMKIDGKESKYKFEIK